MTDTKNDSKKADGQGAAGSTSPKQGQGTGPIEAVWKFFSSVHLAVILLLILAGISIVGTILAQGDSAQDNVELFESLVVKIYDTFGIVDASNPASVQAQHDRIHQAAERLFRFSDRVGFTNLYHAWYFYFLLALFSFNLIVCSIKRWPHTWRMIARNKVDMEARRLTSMSNRKTLTLNLSLADAAENVAGRMKKAGFSPKRIDGEGSVSLFGQKGVLSRLGVYGTHLSIIVILVGGIIGVTSGFKGYMQVTEGTATNRFYDRRSKTYKLLPFQVRCNNFQVDYYGDSRRPKDFYSDLTVVDGGEEKMSKRIEVNSPLVYDDIWFYQSSYGETGQGMKASLRLVGADGGEGRVEQFDTRPRTFDEFGVTVQILQVIPDFALDENQRPYSKSNQSNNPAALVEVKAGEGDPQRTWLFQRYPDVQMSGLPVTVTFVDYGGIQYTGLQVVYDPGVWVIWTGCTLMVLGLYLAFFVSHRRVWARIEEDGTGSKVILAGSANKNKDSFDGEFKRFIALVEGKENDTAET